MDSIPNGTPLTGPNLTHALDAARTRRVFVPKVTGAAPVMHDVRRRRTPSTDRLDWVNLTDSHEKGARQWSS
jgi:hypothetical protein